MNEQETIAIEQGSNFVSAESYDSSASIHLSADQTVEITSPNFPSEYGRYENVIWNVTVPEGSVVHLEILDSEVSESFSK